MLGPGYPVAAFADGAAALRAAQGQPFDLVLTETLATDEGGDGLLRGLRAAAPTAAAPIVLLAAREDAAAERAALAAGADAFLSAPFSRRELLAYVRANLALAGVRREAARREQELSAAAMLVKDRLERILEGINDDFVMYDDEWRYVYVNEQAARSLGLPREQLIGRRIWDLFPSAVGNLFYQEMLRAGAERRDVTFEHYYEPWGKWIENRAYVMPNGMLLFATDITERKRAEATLRESERRFRLLADAAPVLIWISGVDRRFTWVNKQWLEFVGRPMADMLGDKWIEQIHPDDLERCVQIYNSAFEAREPFLIEYRLRRHDGEYRWMLVNGTPLYEAEGEFMGFIGSIVDITERKAAEEALRLSEDRLRLALQSADIGTWDFYPLTEELNWDARCKELFGLGPDAAVTYKLFLAALHPDDSERVRQAVHEALDPAGSGMYAAEFRALGLEGIERWLAANGQALRDDAGRTARFIGTVRDITERKRAEAARTQQLEQERLLRAEAEEASRLKDEFLATVSHELRTPLTAFLGYAQLLQRRTRDEAYVARTVAKLVRSAQDQAQIIEDLLDVSRIVSGKLRIEMRPTDLIAVVTAAIDTVRLAVEAKEQQLVAELSPALGPVVGDANRLQQVVWNLLSNATKFTPPGGRIYVRLEPEGRHAVLTVSDSGQGISAAFLPYAFDRFRQADSTSRRAQGGLGLGLAIVRQLVELHGGTVEAASSGVGRGATFTVRLPLVPLAGTEMGRAPDGPGAAERYPSELAGLRVLIVDDQPDILELLHEILAPCGAVVRTCATAREALELVRAWRPDVLVSDIAMPAEDGYWLIRQVRALAPEQGGDTPAAALTAYVRVEERVRVLAAGFQLYVPKPIEPAELRNVLARLARASAH